MHPRTPQIPSSAMTRALTVTTTMAAALACACFIAHTEALAQISSVTKRTVQNPPLIVFHPATNGYPASAAPGTTTPLYPARPIFIQPVREKTWDEKAAELQRNLDFEKRCAEEGKASFQYSLAMHYLAGYGVEQDDEKAREWLEKAVAKGHDDAKKVLDRLNAERPSRKVKQKTVSLAPAEPVTPPGTNNGVARVSAGASTNQPPQAPPTPP